MPNFPRLRIDERDVCDSTELYTDVTEKYHHPFLFTIYPNPVTDISKLICESNGIVFLYDQLGHLIKKQKVISGDNYLDMEAYLPGVYFINFLASDGKSAGKRIVKVGG